MTTFWRSKITEKLVNIKRQLETVLIQLTRSAYVLYLRLSFIITTLRLAWLFNLFTAVLKHSRRWKRGTKKGLIFYCLLIVNCLDKESFLQNTSLQSTWKDSKNPSLLHKTFPNFFLLDKIDDRIIANIMVFQKIYSILKYIRFNKISFNAPCFSHSLIRNLIVVAAIFVDLTMLIKQELGTRF